MCGNPTLRLWIDLLVRVMTQLRWEACELANLVLARWHVALLTAEQIEDPERKRLSLDAVWALLPRLDHQQFKDLLRIQSTGAREVTLDECFA